MRYTSKNNATPSASNLSQRAKEALTGFKKERGIRAIVPKTNSQKAAQKNWRKRKRIRDYHEEKTMSLGAASEVRIIKP